MALTLWNRKEGKQSETPLRTEAPNPGKGPRVRYVSGRDAAQESIIIEWEGIKRAILAVEPTPAAKELMKQLAVELIEHALDAVTVVLNENERR
jgi:hypothetical protein